MSWFDEIKNSASDFFSGAADTVLGGAQDWLTGEVSQWANTGAEVPGRPETVRPDPGERPASGEEKARQESVALLGQQMGETGTLLVIGVALFLVYQATRS